MEIPIDFNDVQSLTNFQAHLSDKWLDFMLIHTFAKKVLNRNNYLLLTSQASSCLRNDAKNRGGVAKWGKNFFKYHLDFCNIVVVPYLAQNHWSLYILEDKRTIHLDFISRHHDNPPTWQFSHNVKEHGLSPRA